MTSWYETEPTDDPIPDLQRDPRAVRAELDTMRITDQRALHRMWSMLMCPLGFGSASLWLTHTDAEGRPSTHLVELAEMPEAPWRDDPDPLAHFLRHLREAVEGCETVAFLLVRPGVDGMRESDRRTARWLIEAARRAGTPWHPVHIADDLALLPITPDDLAA